MPNQLTLDEYIWAVTDISPDDGFSFIIGYFSTYSAADKFLKMRRANKVIQHSLYKDENGKYYKMPSLQEILVDAPTKEEILSKLTDVEKKVLGLK